MRLPDERADWLEGPPMDQEFGNLPPGQADFHAFHDLTRFARTVPNRLPNWSARDKEQGPAQRPPIQDPTQHPPGRTLCRRVRLPQDERYGRRNPEFMPVARNEGCGPSEDRQTGAVDPCPGALDRRQRYDHGDPVRSRSRRTRSRNSQRRSGRRREVTARASR